MTIFFLKHSKTCLNLFNIFQLIQTYFMNLQFHFMFLNLKCNKVLNINLYKIDF